MATHPSVPLEGEVKGRENSFEWLSISDAIMCWRQLEFRGAILLMKKDLSRVGLSQGRCDRQRREERGELCRRTWSGMTSPRTVYRTSIGLDRRR